MSVYLGIKVKQNKVMKKGTVLFQGDANDSNSYLFAIGENNEVYVLRNFQGHQDCQDLIPSGWNLETVINFPELVIDGGQDWKVYPSKEAWAEIQTLVK